MKTAAIPQLMYGTAWKEEKTAALVSAALKAGFRAIDTANQRKHYHEAGVGEALVQAYEQLNLQRQDLFLQTKFTFVGGQDHRLPYDPEADYPTQVAASFASSLAHLHTDYLDSYVLHGPSVGRGIAAADEEVWAAMSALQKTGNVINLGLSNVSLEQLQLFCALGTGKPKFVQNRCYAVRAWDKDVRSYCHDHEITYQGFSLLTANAQIMQFPEFRKTAQHHQRTPAQIIFRFAAQIGMLPLTGTSDIRHMREDLAIADFELSKDELATIENIACP